MIDHAIMIDDDLASLRAHRNNIRRYQRLLQTSLTDVERRFIEKRLAEERRAAEEIAASTFDLTIPASRRSNRATAVLAAEG